MALSGTETTITIVSILVVVIAVLIVVGIVIYRKHKEDVVTDLKRRYGKAPDSVNTNDNGDPVDSNGNIISPFSDLSDLDPPVEEVVYACGPDDNINVIEKVLKFFADDNTILSKIVVIFGTNDLMECWKNQYSVFTTGAPGTGTRTDVIFQRPHRYTSLYKRGVAGDSSNVTDNTSYIIIVHEDPKKCTNKYLSAIKESNTFSYKCNKALNGELGVNLYLRFTVLGFDFSDSSKTIEERLGNLQLIFVIPEGTPCAPIQITSIFGNEYLNSLSSLQFTFEVSGYYPILPSKPGDKINIPEGAECYFKIDWAPNVCFTVDRGAIGFTYFATA